MRTTSRTAACHTGCRHAHERCKEGHMHRFISLPRSRKVLQQLQRVLTIAVKATSRNSCTNKARCSTHSSLTIRCHGNIILSQLKLKFAIITIRLKLK